MDLLLVVDGGAAGAGMAAAPVLLSDGIDLHKTGAETDADRPFRISVFHKDDPADTAPDGVQIADTGAGLFQGQSKFLLHSFVNINVCYAIFRDLHPVIQMGLEFQIFVCFQIQPGVEGIRIYSHIQQGSGGAHGVAVDTAVLKPPGVGYHAGIQMGGGDGIHYQLIPEGLIEIHHHFTAGGTLLLYPNKVAVAFQRNVVVDLNKLLAERVFFIGDPRL